MLLKEIHHRVKNNLQVISGLLTLQAAQMNDERLQKMIKESQSRIWTMALIHQTLYQSGNLADIDMADYIRNLCGNLLSSYAQVAMPPTIIFDLLPLRLVVDKAIPLALIINELVTNAMKHAFPDGRPGEIRISLQERGARRAVPLRIMTVAPAYELTVADDGGGLPAGFRSPRTEEPGPAAGGHADQAAGRDPGLRHPAAELPCTSASATMKKAKSIPDPGPLRLLIVEDSPADAELIQRELRRAGIHFTSRLVEGKREFNKSLADFQPQVILSDFKMPRFDGLAALKIARLRTPDIPFIFVSGSIGEDKAIETLAHGSRRLHLEGQPGPAGPGDQEGGRRNAAEAGKGKKRGGTAAPGRGGRPLRPYQ